MSSQQEAQEKKKDLISGVFSIQEMRKVGTGTTTRKTIQKAYWFCQELEDGSIEAQLLSGNFIPTGPKKNIPKDDFIEFYSPEPEFYISNVSPKMAELNKTVARADRHRENGEHYSAEMEYGSALKLDIENVRANFGLGLTYLARGETDKAENIMERLVKIDAAFDTEHKHLFNEFGIDLRKNGMHDQALKYYNRAITLAEQDENLFYNIARVHLDQKDFAGAVRYIGKALDINPRHDVSIKFITWLVQKKLVPAESQAEAAEHLKRIQAAQEG